MNRQDLSVKRVEVLMSFIQLPMHMMFSMQNSVKV